MVAEHLPLVSMMFKQWYDHFFIWYYLEKISEDCERLLMLSRVEITNPKRDWEMTWKFEKIKGISNKVQTFLFCMIHKLLQVNYRLFTICHRTNLSPMCNFFNRRMTGRAWNMCTLWIVGIGRE